MLCFCPKSTDVYSNLATEEYLLKHSTEDYFMLWQSDNAVVVGKHQNVEAEVDNLLAESKNIHIARRFSGGGAVFQDLGNLNLTFIETAEKIDFNQYINRIISFLSTIGIQAKADERLGITVNGLKISGSAQCVHKNRVMYHCTLLYSTDLDTLNASLKGKTGAGILPGTQNVRAIASVRSQVTNINREILNPPTLEQFKKLLFDYFLKENTSNKHLHNLTPKDTHSIKTLCNEKYAQPAWIYNRVRVSG